MKNSEAAKKSRQDPEVRKRMSRGMIRAHKNGVYKAYRNVQAKEK
jgi:hypothetical protein